MARNAKEPAAVTVEELRAGGKVVNIDIEKAEARALVSFLQEATPPEEESPGNPSYRKWFLDRLRQRIEEADRLEVEDRAV